MNYKLPFFILVVGVTALGLIAFSPAIYAAIEPHITIMMDPGQQTNPLQIKDSSNNDVFSIDTNGIIYPNQDGWVKFLYQSGTGGEITTVTDTIDTDPIVLAEWSLTFSDQSAPFQIIAIDLVMFSSEVIKISGSNACVMEAQSLQFGTWGTNDQMSSSSASWTSIEQEAQAYQDSDWDGFRYVVWNGGDGIGTCQWKNTGLIVNIVETPNLTVTRIS